MNSLRRETRQSIRTDTACCPMKSVKGYCPKPLEAASAFLTKKWMISIIVTIGNFRTLRFNNLLDRLDHTTAKTLTTRLRELERLNLIQRHRYPELPPRVEYSLTNTGTQLLRALSPLMHWAEHHQRRPTSP